MIDMAKLRIELTDVDHTSITFTSAHRANEHIRSNGVDIVDVLTYEVIENDVRIADEPSFIRRIIPWTSILYVDIIED